MMLVLQYHLTPYKVTAKSNGGGSVPVVVYGPQVSRDPLHFYRGRQTLEHQCGPTSKRDDRGVVGLHLTRCFGVNSQKFHSLGHMCIIKTPTYSR